MQAARMASTVRSDRAKPTKYVCSGRRPSLNNHLAETRETSEFSIYKSRLSKYLPTQRATDGSTEVMSSLTKELGRFFSWPDLPTCGSIESETVKILEIHKTQRVSVCCVLKMTQLLVNQTILPVVIILHIILHPQTTVNTCIPPTSNY